MNKKAQQLYSDLMLPSPSNLKIFDELGIGWSTYLFRESINIEILTQAILILKKTDDKNKIISKKEKYQLIESNISSNIDHSENFPELLHRLTPSKTLKAKLFCLYREHLKKHRKKLKEILQKNISQNPKTIIFCSKRIFFNQIRYSQALKEKGWNTIAIVFDQKLARHQKDFFDSYFYTDLASFLSISNQFENLIIHTQGWLFRYQIPALINAFNNPDNKHIVEMADINSFFLPGKNLDQLVIPMQKVWGEDALDKQAFQINCEKVIFNYSDGVIFMGDKGHQKKLLKNLDKINKKKFINFYPYPLKSFFTKKNRNNNIPKNKVPELVFIGGVPPKTSNYPPELFSDAQLTEMLSDLIHQNLNITIFNNPLKTSPKDQETFYKEILQLEKNNSNFTYKIGLPPWQLNQQLEDYQWGLMLYYFKVKVGNNHFKHIIPTKFFHYIEGGLPVLVSERFQAVCKIVSKYQLGLVIKEKDIKNLSSILSKTDHASLKNNVLTFREEFSLNKKITELIELYEYR